MTKIDTSHEINGYWWIPSNPDTKWYGTLKYKKGEVINLLIIDESLNLYSTNDLIGLDAIWGEANDGRQISLINCYVKNTTTTMKGKGKREIEALYLLEDWHLSSLDSNKIRCAHVRFDSVEKWFNTSGLKIDLKKRSNNFDLKYRKPEPIKININDDLNLLINFNAPRPIFIFPGTKWSFKETINIEIQPIGKANYNSIFNIVRILQDFFTIAFLQYPSIEYLYLESDIEDHKYEDGRILYKNGEMVLPYTYYEYKPPEIRQFEILFLYNYVKDNVEQILQNWFSKHEKLQHVLNHYNTAIHSNKGYLEPQFLALTRAIEIYHRKFKSGKYVKDDYYKKDLLPLLRSAIPDEITGNFRVAIKNRFQYLNEYSLSKRLKIIVKENEEALKNLIPDIDNYINPIVDYRNYFTHYEYNKSIQNENINYDNLLYFNEILRFILDICFLVEMGFSKEQIIEITGKNNLYRRYLRKTT